METRGAKRDEIAGLNDKRQITAVFCGTLTGTFLPVQLVYTDDAIPSTHFLLTGI